MAYRLTTTRLTDDSLVSSVDDALGALETMIGNLFGVTLNSNVTTSPFKCDNSGRITKTLLETVYPGGNNSTDLGIETQPIGIDIIDSGTLAESQLCISRFVDYATGVVDPRFFIAGQPGGLFGTNNGGVANYATLCMKPGGELYGKPVSTTGQGLVPQSSGSASEYFNGLCAWSPIGAFTQQARIEGGFTTTAWGTGTTKTVNFTTERLDTSTMIDISGAPTVVTCRENGTYHISASAGIAFIPPCAASSLDAVLLLNGVTTIAHISIPLSATESNVLADMETIYVLTAGDTLSMQVTQDSGDDATVQNPTTIELHRIA